MTATLHMMKLCVGAANPEVLERWQRDRFGGGPAEHVTRMWPKRAEELLLRLILPLHRILISTVFLFDSVAFLLLVVA